MNTQEQPHPRQEAGRELRCLVLGLEPSEAGFASDTEFPRVYGVVADWHIGEHVATIVALRDGTASLYTTSTFGVIGGAAHEKVRLAAQECVRCAEKFVGSSLPAADTEYPRDGEILFYLLTYDGLRVCSASEEEIYEGQHPMGPFFGEVQNVLTELRFISQQ